MIINTRLFGDIDIDEQKIITFDTGIVGFDYLKNFTLIHEAEKESKTVLWMQSVDEPEMAIPVLNPLMVKPDYNPVVEDEIIRGLGKIEEEQIFVLVTLSVPADIKEMSVNLKAPVIINPGTLKACQVIVENEDYPIRFKVYEILKEDQKKDGE